jgi:LacI family transcriptional regulator
MVSYILNDTPAISVPAETRRRVLDAMETLGYVPDRRAQSLRTRQTFTLAGIIPDITNPFYPAFERGIQDVAEQHGYDLVMYNTDGIAEKERKCLRSVQQGHVDGIIGVFFHATAADLRTLIERQIAVVRFESWRHQAGDLPLDTIYLDNRAAAHAAVSYLIACGHTRIGMIAGRLGPRAERVKGYRQALADHDLALDGDLVRDTDFTQTGGYTGMRELLALSPRPSAVFAANDLLAMGALLLLREQGLRVPDDVAVIGFDDIPTASLVTPPLTTVAQCERDIGRRAAEMMLERLSGAAPDEGRCEEMPYQLIVRGSA